MAKFRVETQIAIDKASTAAAKQGMEVLTGAAMKMFAIMGGAKLATAPIKAYIGMIEDSIAASEKATAAQDRMQVAISNVYKTIGDEMTPGLNELANSIQQALANPEIQKGLESMGQLLSLMASGIATTVTEIADFVGSPEFSKWLQFIYGVDLNSDAVKAYIAQGKAVDEITAAVSKWAKGVAEQKKEEDKAAEARKKAHQEHLKDLQAILDKVNPVGKAEREAWQQILTLNQSLKAGEIDVNTYQQALAFLTRELNNVKAAAELAQQAIPTLDIPARDINTDLPAGPMQGGSMTIEQIETSASRYNEAFTEANKQLAANLESGLTSAFTSALLEFAHGGEDAFKHFGEAMLDVLLNSVAQWLAAQLAAIAKAAIASKAIGGSTGGAGGGAGGMSSLFGGKGMSSGAGIALGVVAVMAGLVAVLKHQTDRANAVRYDTTSGAVATDGAVQSGFTGKLHETGQKVSEAISGLLNAFQAATGAFILGTATAEVQIRNDKERFRAVVNGVLVGEFASINEAIIAAAKTAFLNADLSATLDPAIQQVIANFQGDDPQKMVDAINAVRQIVDEVSGLTDVEIALRDLPQQTAAMAGQLMGLGVAFDEANRLAGQWQVTQLQNIRDQITGHQQSAAEQMAERQRQAALFNAQVSLMRAETQLKRDEIAVRVEALRASGQMFEGMVTLANAELQTQSLYLQSKADLYEQDTQIHQWYLDTLGQTANASLQMLEAQLAALDAMLANLPELISPGEIHLPNTGSHGGGGGGGTAGPTEAEQRATAFNDFMKNLARDGMTEVQRALAELNDRFAEQAQAARELGRVEELEAERVKAIARIRQDFLDGFKLDGMTEYQRRLFELNKAFADQAALNADLAGSEAELAAARRAALNALREDLLDSFGTPMEALRDRIAGIQQKLADLAAANNELLKQFQNGEISAREYADAIAHGEEVVHDFVLGLGSEFLNLALYFTDALGDTQESARIRKQLAILEWQYKKLELVMMLNAIRLAGGFGAATVVMFNQLGNSLVGMVNRVAAAAGNVVVGGPAPVDPTLPPPPTIGGWTYQQWMDWINSLPDAPPGGGAGDSSGSNAAEEARNQAEQALRAALDRLRSAIESLREFEKGLLLSSASPLTTSQQYEEAARQYAATLAAAQGGDLAAIEALAGDAQTYLELAAQMFGTAGAGYGDIFAAVQQQIADIIASGQQVLDSAPPQMAGTEDRLDTIAEILRAMAGIGAGTGGGGTNPHAGLVYYGPEWGWHPMGWSPGGNTPPANNISTAASLGSFGNLSIGNFSQPGSAVTVRAPELLAKIDQLVTAHQEATVEAKNDRMKKTVPSLSGYLGRPIGSRRSA